MAAATGESPAAATAKAVRGVVAQRGALWDTESHRSFRPRVPADTGLQVPASHGAGRCRGARRDSESGFLSSSTLRLPAGRGAGRGRGGARRGAAAGGWEGALGHASSHLGTPSASRPPSPSTSPVSPATPRLSSLLVPSIPPPSVTRLRSPVSPPPWGAFGCRLGAPRSAAPKFPWRVGRRNRLRRRKAGDTIQPAGRSDPATARMNLEGVMLNERSQILKPK